MCPMKCRPTYSFLSATLCSALFTIASFWFVDSGEESIIVVQSMDKGSLANVHEQAKTGQAPSFWTSRGPAITGSS
jgi:hypothetical protein